MRRCGVVSRPPHSHVVKWISCPLNTALPTNFLAVLRKFHSCEPMYHILFTCQYIEIVHSTAP